MEVSSMNGQDIQMKSPYNAATASPPGAHGERADEVRPDDEKAEYVAREDEVERPARAPTAMRSGVRMRIDELTKRIVAQIVDEDNKVIKQIPPEEALKLAQRIRAANGLIFDRKA